MRLMGLGEPRPELLGAPLVEEAAALMAAAPAPMATAAAAAPVGPPAHAAMLLRDITPIKVGPRGVLSPLDTFSPATRVSALHLSGSTPTGGMAQQQQQQQLD